MELTTGKLAYKGDAIVALSIGAVCGATLFFGARQNFHKEEKMREALRPLVYSLADKNKDGVLSESELTSLAAQLGIVNSNTVTINELEQQIIKTPPSIYQKFIEENK